MSEEQQDDGAGEEPEGKKAPVDADTPEAEAPPEPVAEEPPPAPVAKPQAETPPEPTKLPVPAAVAKPIHSWSWFVVEYAVVALGVLTALGLEQAIGNYNEQRQVEEARAAIEEDLRLGIASAHILRDSRDCRLRQFQAMAVVLGQGKMEQFRSMLAGSRIIPSSTIPDTAWTTALTTGVANRFDLLERSDLELASFISRSSRDFFRDYQLSNVRLQFLAQDSFGGTPAVMAQATEELAEMYTIINNLDGAMGVYRARFENGWGLKAEQADFDRVSGAAEFKQNCEAAADTLEAMAGEG